MSAAAPLPPPYPTSSGTGGHNDTRPPSNSNNNGGERAYAHIQDLRIQALTGFNRGGSVQQLLGDADRALSQAETLLNFRRPELSYVEYLRASEIVVEVIPRNKAWPDFQMDHSGGGMQKYHMLQKRINAKAEQYAGIKGIIENNNKRSGVQPQNSAGEGYGRNESIPQMNGSSTNGAATPPRVKPSPSPKPEKLHGKAISSATSGIATSNNSNPWDALSDRFAKLRSTPPIDTGRPDSRNSNPSSVHSSPISLVPNPNGLGGRSSLDNLSRTPPVGPRAMPAPPIPGKLPLDTGAAASMPKEPSPTYSPARNMETTGNIAPPRHTARSLASTSSRRTSVPATSSASSHAPNGVNSSSSADYFPAYNMAKTSGAPPPPTPRRKSVNVPKETRISAGRLYDYLLRFSILLIDFRPREDFDLGHIYATNVICIEPVQVSQGMSAEQLLDRMVISPESEQEMLMNRDKYDLVVYYDADTQSESYLTRPMGELQTKLKYLHEALSDFNQEKPLLHPPILLIGGIDAWMDMLSPQALAVSNTAARVKQGRPIQRRKVVGNGSTQLRNPKRRLRDYNPLDDEEEQRWRERARAESVVLQPPTNVTGDTETVLEEASENDEEPNSAIREFLERFPEAGSLEKHAFGPLHPMRSAPEPPPKVPLPRYPPPPPSSTFQSAPMRPPPAAPRMSYTGVSDRAGSQNAPAVRSSSSAPYIPPKYISTNLRLPKTGLHNFRFTCYMNSTLQALSATTPLSIFFLEDSFHGLLQRQNFKGTKGVLPELYSNLIRSLWKDDCTFVKPSTFRGFCGRLRSEWGRDDQEQDAKEFFDFLIDCLHEDMNQRWDKPPLKQLTPDEEAKRERMPKSWVARVEWGRFTHRDQSFITSLFGGQYSSRLQCLTCGFTSTTYDAFYSLSVEIPNMRYPTMNDCLNSYCAQETLRGEDRARCERCKELRDFTKQINITRAPQILVVHFKRFKFRNAFDRSAQKIHTPIDFPLENFDLEPYMLKQPSPDEAERIMQDYGPDALKSDASMTPPYTYDAYGVIRHLGHSLEQGHYKSLVKDRARRTWRCFNDREVTDFVPGQGEYRGQGDLRNGQAYIVFYQRTLHSQMGNAGAPGKM